MYHEKQIDMPNIAAIIFNEGEAVDCSLEKIVRSLQAKGHRIAGYIQREIPETDNCCSIMDLENISDGVKYRISQTLGPGSRGCRLDFNGLANASVNLAAELENGADLIVLNRFGKGESEGQGFRAIIQKAIELNIPVLTAVRDAYLPYWLEFGGEFAQTIKNSDGKGLEWCLASMQRAHATV